MGNASGASRVPALVGQVIDGRYRVDAVLARGGMGAVLRGTHVILNQPVAIKVMLDGTMRDPSLRDRFLREARILAQVRSPSIASIFDAGLLPDGTLYLVMELLEGEDLERTLRAGPMSLAAATKVVSEVCEGLAEAHEKGIVHRDLKPANIFLVEKANGETVAKIIDFGISKQLGDTSESTGLGNLVGSPSYMAPEQIKASRDVDRRADIWSLGVILFRLVLGKLPFEGPNLAVILTRIRGAEPELPTDLDPDFVRVVRRCLEKDPARRFSSVSELRESLASLARGTGFVQGRYAEAPRGKVDEERHTESGVVVIAAREDEAVSSASSDSSMDAKTTLRIAPRGMLEGARRLPDTTLPDTTLPVRVMSAGTSSRSEDAASAALTQRLEKVAIVDVDAMGDQVTRAPPLGSTGESIVLPVSRPPLLLLFGVAMALALVGLSFQFRSRSAAEVPDATTSAAASAEALPGPSTESALTTRPRAEPLAEASVAVLGPGPSAGAQVTEGPRVAPEVKSAVSYLTLQSTPESAVALDGKSLGTTPKIKVAVAPGAHTLVFGNPTSSNRKSMSVTLRSGEAKTVAVNLAQPPPKPTSTAKYGEFDPL
jgi:serine/threonine-protein kinase